MSDIDFSKIKLPQPNFGYTNEMISSLPRSQEESLRAVQKAREAKEAEKLRRHNELVAALKEAGEKGATIVIGDNANGIQIQQNSAGAQQKMDNEQTFNYEKASERSLEAVGKSVGLHIIGRSKVFNLFPRTDKGKNWCVLRQKHALINSRERPRIQLHIRHQDEAIEPCGVRLLFEQPETGCERNLQ